MQLRIAYETLSDDQKRMGYDGPQKGRDLAEANLAKKEKVDLSESPSQEVATWQMSRTSCTIAEAAAIDANCFSLARGSYGRS